MKPREEGGYDILSDGKLVAQAGPIAGPVEVTLAKGATPGENGQPTLEEVEGAIRNELTDLLTPGHSIVFRRQQEE